MPKKERIITERILTICKSNIFRSQIAKAYIEALAQLPIVISAGMKVQEENWKYGRTPTPRVVEVMKERGFDIQDYPVTQFSPEMLEGIKLVLVFCDEQTCPPSVFAQASVKVLYLEIEDPEGKDTQTFRDTCKKIEDAIYKLKEEGQLAPYIYLPKTICNN